MTEIDLAPKKPRVIVIRKKKALHGGRHGGAWKVAYADFVTAMMALFIVLWLMGTDQDTQKQIASYFNDPHGSGKQTGTAAAGFGNALEIPKEDMKDLQEKIQRALMTVPNFRNLQDHIEITVTADGLRIELLESDAGMFFQSGKPEPTPGGAALLTRLAEELGKLPNSILLEGHTDAKPFGGSRTYTNWELSIERAAAARRLMEAHGIRANQIGQLRGYADRALRRPEDPENATNRRISVIVQYLQKPEAAGKDKAPATEVPGKKH